MMNERPPHTDPALEDSSEGLACEPVPETKVLVESSTPPESDETEVSLFEQVETLIEQQNYAGLAKVLSQTHPADIAQAFRPLSDEERLACLDVLADEIAADVIEQLDFDLMVDTMAMVDTEKVVQLMHFMPADEAVDVLNEFEDDKVVEIIRRIPDLRYAKHLKELMTYPEDSVGSIMSSELVKIYADMKVEETLNYLRVRAEQENTSFYYLYVVDRTDKLVGVIGLRNLMTSPPYIVVEDIMKRDVISVNHLDDKEDAAELTQKYQLLSLPVVDNAEKLKGIVTWDDAVEVLEEKLTDQFYTSSGLSTEAFETGELLSGDFLTAIKSRTPWLLFTLLGSFVTVWVGDIYTHTIQTLPILAIFIPLLGGMGGNVGTQSSALIVRGLATGHVSLEKALTYIWQQSVTGILIGVIIGLIVGAVVLLWKGNPWLGAVIGGSLLANITVAATIGTLIPLAFKRYDIDPAIASSPFISTAIDITGLTIYFSLATIGIRMLVAAPH